MNDDGHDHAGHDHNHAGHSHDLSADALLQAVARRREQFPTRLRREAGKLGLNDEVIGQVRERQTLRNERNGLITWHVRGPSGPALSPSIA